MKVYELMELLAKIPSGLDVVVGQGDDFRTEALRVENNSTDGNVALIGDGIPESERA